MNHLIAIINSVFCETEAIFNFVSISLFHEEVYNVRQQTFYLRNFTTIVTLGEACIKSIIII